MLFLGPDANTRPPVESIQNTLRVSGVRDPYPTVQHIDESCEAAIRTPFGEIEAVSVDLEGGFVAVTPGIRVDDTPPSLTMSASIDFPLPNGEADSLRIQDFVLRDSNRGIAHEPCLY